MGTPSIMTILATWTSKVVTYDITSCGYGLAFSGVHRSCTREDVVRLKVMHAEQSLAKGREFSAKV